MRQKTIAPSLEPEQVASEDESADSGDASGVLGSRAAMALGVALFVAVLVALGIQGDLLLSMIRNSPIPVEVAFGLVLVGLALPFFAGKGITSRLFPRLAVALLVAGTISTVIVAVNSYSVRERPTLAFTPSWSTETDGVANLNIKATASSLVAQDMLAMRVVGFKGEATREGSVCSTMLDEVTLPESDLLFIGGSGPNKPGAATLEISIPVSSKDYDFVCAFANVTFHASDKEHNHVSGQLLNLHTHSVVSESTKPLANSRP